MKNKKLIIIIFTLSIMVLILGYINMKSMGPRAENEGTITFIAGDSSTELNFEEITSLESKDFRATEDTSTTDPTSRTYKGVLLKSVLNMANIDDDIIASYSKVVVSGLDGYVIALGTDEILSRRKNVFLAYEKDGKSLGTMKRGGSGPFQMIATADVFAQRWCKYVYEVRLE